MTNNTLTIHRTWVKHFILTFVLSRTNTRTYTSNTNTRILQLITDKRSGRSKGFAYVELRSLEDVPKALALNGQPFQWKKGKVGFPVLVKPSNAEKNYQWNINKKQEETDAWFLHNRRPFFTLTPYHSFLADGRTGRPQHRSRERDLLLLFSLLLLRLETGWVMTAKVRITYVFAFRRGFW